MQSHSEIWSRSENDQNRNLDLPLCVYAMTRLIRVFQWINGPAGNQLGTRDNIFLKDPGIPYDETGIITGDRSINLFLSCLIPGPDDGKVSVENTKLAGMKDFLVVHRSHPFIMTDKTVCRQVSAFLRNGCFDRA